MVTKEEWEAIDSKIDSLERYKMHEDTTLGYAQRLATFLWEKHYKKDAPEWKPLPNLIGVLTQIDNMTAGLVRADR